MGLSSRVGALGSWHLVFRLGSIQWLNHEAGTFWSHLRLQQGGVGYTGFGFFFFGWGWGSLALLWWRNCSSKFWG